MDKLFITPEEFKDYKNISVNMDLDRMNTYINDAQFIDLTTFIGKELYLLLQLDYDDVTGSFTNPLYTDLFFGTDYNNIRYYGLEPMLVEYAYARTLEAIQLNITRAGVRKFEDEQSVEMEQAQINSKVATARSMALAYQVDAIAFLKAKSTDYPTWNNTNTKNTGMNFFKV